MTNARTGTTVFRDRHRDLIETPRVDVWVNVEWSCWGIGIFVWRDDFDGVIQCGSRIGPVVLGWRISPKPCSTCGVVGSHERECPDA